MEKYHFNISELQAEEIVPGVYRKNLAGDLRYTFCYMEAGPKEGDPAHTHANEQVIFILSGDGLFRLGDEVFPIRAGDCILIPENEAHTFEHFNTLVTWIEVLVPGRGKA